MAHAHRARVGQFRRAPGRVDLPLHREKFRPQRTDPQALRENSVDSRRVRIDRLRAHRCSGLRVPRGPGTTRQRRAPGWQLVWVDEFEGTDGSRVDTTRWSAVTGGSGWGNQEREYYTDNIAIFSSYTAIW